jgi:hypothetical protein
MSSSSEPIERIEIATIERSGHDQVRIGLIRMPDDLSWWLSARIWFRNKAGEFAPGRGGLTFPASMIPELSAAISAAVQEVRDRALIE